MQLSAAKDTATTEDAYMAVIRAKTAALFAAACEVGPILAERSKAEGAAARAWGARGIPTTIIVDKQGQETARLEGAADWASDAAAARVRDLVQR